MAAKEYERHEAKSFVASQLAVGVCKLTRYTIMRMRGADLCARWLLVFLVIGIVGCVKTPRFVKPVLPNEMLTQDGGPMLISNVCLQRRVLFGANHFVVGEGERAATEIDKQLRSLLAYHGITILGQPLTSVCGVTFDSATPLKAYAQVMDGEVSEGEQPLKRSEALSNIAPDSKALGILLAELQIIALSRPSGPNDEDWREDLPAVQLSEYSREVLEVLERASGRSQMLFIGIDGNNESGGKTAAFITGAVVLSVAAAVAAGPAALGTMSVAQTVSVNAVAAASAQFMPVSGTRTIGAWVDATRGEVRWTGWRNGGLEPLSEVWFWSGLPVSTSVFDPLILRKDDHWSPPGIKVRP